MAAQVERARWEARYRFFPDANGFPADTDCTAIAAGALYEHGLLPDADLNTCARELFKAAAPGDEEATLPGRGDENALCPQVFMVYWEDEAEPFALRRGRKQDPVACANALYTVQLAGRPLADDGQAAATVEATTRYLADHLISSRYLGGTRYYPSPDAFLYAASRLCARFPDTTALLAGPLRRAFHRREATAPSQGLAAVPGRSLNLAFRTLTADHLGLTAGQEERRALLAALQRDDGSWPPCSYYRMGRFPVYFGSPYLTTVFALAALRSGVREDCG
ncbi:hypothetical protein [Streptomyces sp. NPDC023588]|uniref:hypothetical protein n=1 Tax=Streptomyces sp. NPDC023588 TaxID=3154907 RepID=UPI0033D6D05A